MALSRSSQVDPISERSRTLTAEIAALEAQIRDLGEQLESSQGPTRNHQGVNGDAHAHSPEPGFEPPHRSAMPRQGLFAGGERRSAHEPDAAEEPPGRKQKPKKRRRSGSQADPRLISYLAAGSIQGLRPLRYEKRVARNRVFVLTLVFLFVFWGLVALLRS